MLHIWPAHYWHEVSIMNQGVLVCEYRGISGYRDFDSGQTKFLPNIFSICLLSLLLFGVVLKSSS